MSKSILIIEDEDTLRESLTRLFKKDGFTVDAASSAEKGLALSEENFYDVIISDIILPGMDGIEMLTRIREQSPDQTFIVTTAYASLETAVRALRVGAYDYIMKPIIHEEIKQVVNNAIRQEGLQKENLLLKRQIKTDYDFSCVIGEDKALKGIIEELRKISDTKSSVMLLGETGTGKELFARVIHHNSSRRDMPFVPINCSAIPEPLLESELFGHVKGAFTGAVSSKTGLLHEADGGTVFLDEIGDMPQSIQVKLLRMLEDSEIRPLGSTRVKKVNIRFITATNKDIRELVDKGLFREDLYYRINVITLKLPPLRERKEDIPSLATHYLEKYAREFGKPLKSLSPRTLSVLGGYGWPGNIREMQNVLERAVLISDSDTITEESLPENIKAKGSFPGEAIQKSLSIDEYTRTFIQNYQHMYGEQQLAEKLGITRKTLWEKRKKWGIRRDQPPDGPKTPSGNQ
jgi:DNA-binding NtrC family response regulator